MKHFRILTVAMALTAVLTACTDNENEQNNANERTALTIHAGIGTTKSPRATEATWQADDAIGILLLDAGTSTANDKKTNYQYKTTDGKGAFAPINKENTAYFPSGSAQVDILAYYPYSAAVTPTNLTVSVDVSRQTDLPAIDLLTAEKVEGCSSAAPTVNLSFSHRLCKLVLKVVTDATTTDIDLAGAKAVLTGTAATASWNLLTAQLEAVGKPTEIELAMAEDGTTSTAIVMPTTAGEGKSITLTTADGKRYTAPIADNLALTAGTVNTYTMTLHHNQAAIMADITPWVTGTPVQLESLHIEVPADATVAGMNTFTMWRNRAQDTDSRVYTFHPEAAEGAGAWTATPKPFYIEEITETDRFYAVAQDKGQDAGIDPVTGLNDLLAAGPVASTSNTLSLNFSHLMARFTPVLKTETDFPAANLTQATLQLPALAADYLLGYDDESGALQVVEKADAPTVVYPEMAFATTDTEHTYLLVPQTIAAGTTFSIKLADKTYTAKAESAIHLEAGRNTQLTFTLQVSETAVQVSVKEWTNTDIDGGDIKLSDVTDGGTIALPADAKGDFHLTAIESPTEISSIYHWDGTKLTASSTGALTWDQLKPQTHDFRALFAPTATMPANHERDYLTGSLSNLDFGALLNFSELTHPNAQLSLKITSADGTCTNEEIAAAVVSLTSTKECRQNGSLLTFEDAEKEVTLTHHTDGSFNALLAPQTIAKMNISIAGKPYILTKAVELKAGTRTVVTADIKRSTIGMTISLVDWKQDITDGGDIEIDK